MSDIKTGGGALSTPSSSSNAKPGDDANKPQNHAEADGTFKRKESAFRNWISKDAGAEFPAEKGRYVLYLNLGCPWAHRTNIVRSLKGLEDVIQLVLMTARLDKKDGWLFKLGEDDSMEADPLYGHTCMRELYEHAEPGYSYKYTVPCLWDKKKETIVNNESSEIIRMFYTEFDALLPEHLREENKANGGLLPPQLKDEIDEFNSWVYDLVNNGVYKTGFAGTQAAYEANVFPLFEALDRIEAHLSQPGHSPYLFGDHITEADIRLFVTMIRFDAAYVTIFRCNLRMVRFAYPKIDKWLRELYWNSDEKTNGGAFKKTTDFDIIKKGYAVVKGIPTPVGPLPHILPLEG